MYIYLFVVSNAYENLLERNAGAVIHIHSQEVVKLCLLNPENEIRITDLEIIKVSIYFLVNNVYK